MTLHYWSARIEMLNDVLSLGDQATVLQNEEALHILESLGFSAAANTMRPVMPPGGELRQDNEYIRNKRLFGIGIPELPAPAVLADKLRAELAGWS